MCNSDDKSVSFKKELDQTIKDRIVILQSYIDNLDHPISPPCNNDDKSISIKEELNQTIEERVATLQSRIDDLENEPLKKKKRGWREIWLNKHGISMTKKSKIKVPEIKCDYRFHKMMFVFTGELENLTRSDASATD
jgi:uncharacterized small protein (DUF1192 family)